MQRSPTFFLLKKTTNMRKPVSVEKESNEQMQMRSNKELRSLTLGSAHEKFDV